MQKHNYDQHQDNLMQKTFIAPSSPRLPSLTVTNSTSISGNTIITIASTTMSITTARTHQNIIQHQHQAPAPTAAAAQPASQSARAATTIPSSAITIPSSAQSAPSAAATTIPYASRSLLIARYPASLESINIIKTITFCCIIANFKLPCLSF